MVVDIVDVKEGDVVLVVSNWLMDNLWENEILQKVREYMQKWESGEHKTRYRVRYVARTLIEAAKEVALDPNGESPYMEQGVG